jgi:prepilin-type N-terminal cleavage/methylation domain-containing protein
MPFLNRRLEHSGCSWQAGFTILELLVVLAILGLLVGMVAPAAMQQLGGAKNKIAQQSIARITESLDIYKLDIGAYFQQRRKCCEQDQPVKYFQTVLMLLGLAAYH